MPGPAAQANAKSRQTIVPKDMIGFAFRQLERGDGISR
jgi:hypothetical protein